MPRGTAISIATIGFPRRLRSAVCTAVRLRQPRRQVLEIPGAGVESCGQLLGAAPRPVGDVETGNAARLQVVHDQLRRLARAHDQPRGLLQLAEDALGQVRRRAGHGNISTAHARGLRDLLAHPERGLEEPVEGRTHGPRLLRRAIRGLDLPPDLSLAHHEAVEGRRDEEEVLAGVPPLPQIAVLGDLRRFDSRPFRDPGDDAVGILHPVGVDLETIAGGQDHRLPGDAAQHLERPGGVADAAPLPQLDGSGLVVEAD